MTTELSFPERLALFKAEWYKHLQSIASEVTPKVDDCGRGIIQRRPDGFDYIVESYMRDRLDYHFPGWSWESAAPLHFLGAEWVVAQGHLVIPDPYLAACGIQPPVRKFFGCDSVRIQYKTIKQKDLSGKEAKVSLPHTPENIVDVGDNCKQANTAALKFSINRLCRIGDDVYGKRLEVSGE